MATYKSTQNSTGLVPDPYTGMEDVVLNENVSGSLDLSPMEGAKRRQLSRATRVPEAAIDKTTLSMVEREANRKKIDINSLKSNSPKTAKYLAKDPNNAAISREDIETGNMQGIELAFDNIQRRRTPKQSAQAAPAAAPQVAPQAPVIPAGQTKPQYQSTRNPNDAPAQNSQLGNSARNIAKSTARLASGFYRIGGQLLDAGMSLDETIPLEKGMTTVLTEPRFGGIVLDADFVPRFLNAEELAAVTPERTSLPAPLTPNDFPDFQSFDKYYQEVLGDESNPLTRAANQLTAETFGYEERFKGTNVQEFIEDGEYIEAVVESLGMVFEKAPASVIDMIATLVAFIPYVFTRAADIGRINAMNRGVKPNINDTLRAVPFALASSALERILPQNLLTRMRKIGVGAAGLTLIRRVYERTRRIASIAGAAGAIEGFTEVVQEVIIEYTAEIIGTPVKYDLKVAIDRAVEAVIVGTGAGVAIGGSVANAQEIRRARLVNRLEVVQRVQEARETAQQEDLGDLDTLNQKTAESKTKGYDSETFKQFTDSLDENGETKVYIDSEQLTKYMETLDPAGIASDPALVIMAEKLAVTEKGVDVTLTMSEFVNSIAGTTHYEPLRDHLTASEEGVSLFRQEDARANSESYIRGVIANAEVDSDEFKESQRIFEETRSQLIDTGVTDPVAAKFMAQFVPAYFAARAKRLGLPIAEVYARAGLSIQGPQTGEAQRQASELALLQEAKDLGYEGDNAGESRQWVAGVKKFGAEGMTTEARMARAKGMGFDVDNTYYTSTLRDTESFNATGRFAGFSGVSGISVTDSAEMASRYLARFGNVDYKGTPFNKNVMAVLIKTSNTLEGASPYTSPVPMGFPLPEGYVNPLIADGFDSMRVPDSVSRGGAVKHSSAKNAIKGDEIILTNPNQIRSVNAVFDPDQAEGADLLFQPNEGEQDGQTNAEANADALGGAEADGQVDITGPETRTLDQNEFRSRLKEAKEADVVNGPSVTLYDEQDYFDQDVYLFEDGLVGFTLDDTGYIGSMFKHPDSQVKGVVGKVLPLAIKAGGVRLDAFRGPLTEMYAAQGFKETSFLPWDDQYAPDGWDYDKSGRPDVVEMVLDNEREQTAETNTDEVLIPSGIRRGVRLLPEQNQQGNQATRDADGSLAGLPRNVGGFTASAFGAAQDVARKYMESTGRPYNPPTDYVKVDKARSSQIADEFTKGTHAPKDPKVLEAFGAMITETNAQYDMMLEAGVKIEFIDYDKTGDPYDGSPRQMTEDVRNNNHMYVFATEDGFGSSDLDVSENPLLAATKYKDLNGKPMLANDVFRAVHDYFGHVKEGVGFRADGEENAWRAHAAMYSPLAMRAMTTETRGQNSWVNYGPNGAFNRTAGGADTIYAPQKVMLLPEWVTTEGSGAAADAFNQGETGARGYYDPANSMIRLNEAANLSTFIHEFSHFMYETELRDGDSDIAAEAGKWFMRNVADVAKEANRNGNGMTGVTLDDVQQYVEEGTSGDSAKDTEIRRATHEQFARGFEAYVMEGKAPTVGLRDAFRKLAGWMIEIYRTTFALDVNLDAGIRNVFDRLLASQEQIDMARDRARLEPLFTDATMAGMTEAQFAEYQSRGDSEQEVQEETLRDQVMKEITRVTKAWWKQETNDIIDTETDRLRVLRVYRAREILRSPDGEVKLDHASVKAEVGETRRNRVGVTQTVIPRALSNMTAKGQVGMPLDDAARMLGYDSGTALLADLMEAPTLANLAAENAQQQMLDIHGDILNDGTIEREADLAVQNEQRGVSMLRELRQLNRGTNRRNYDRQQIKDIAKAHIAEMSDTEISPAKYRRAEIREAQNAARLLAEGDKAGASVAKTQQAVNHFLAIEATEAKNETVKIVDFMARYRKKKVREEIQKAGNGYWEQITKILGRFEFRRSATLRGVNDQNEAVRSWMEERMREDGDALVITETVLNEMYSTHYKNVPHGELMGVRDSVKNMEHAARYANKIQLNDERIDFKKFVNQWTDHIDQTDQKFPTRAEKDMVEDAAKATMGDTVRRWTAQLTKVPFLASWLDGGERVGMSHDVMMDGFNRALDHKMRLADEVMAPVLKMIADRSSETMKRHARLITIPEIENTMTGDQVLAAALNVGNAGNLRKMMMGEGWVVDEADVSINHPKMQAVLKHMTKEDWDFVQTVWDQMNLLYPMLAEVHRKTTGLVPPKVESVPVVTPFGTYAGGYYPVKYSRARSNRAARTEQRQEAQVESRFESNGSLHQSISTSATEARTGYYDKIKMDLSVIPEHFNDTIHYITHHDAVRQMNKILNDPKIEDSIVKVMGEAEYNFLNGWLNDIANDGKDEINKTYIAEWFQRLRFGTTLGVMGFSASTQIMQVFGILTTAAEVGIGPTVKGVVRVVGQANYMRAVRRVLGSTESMQTGWEFATERSLILQHRMKTMDREMRNAMARLKNQSGMLAVVQEASMKHIAYTQTYIIDLPTWHAAYQKGIQDFADEARAAKYADWAVENLQGSGATKDMAPLLRSQNKLESTFTMFMTYFSAMGNLNRDMVRGARSGRYSISGIAGRVAFLTVIPVLIDMLMRGQFDEPEDDDDRLARAMLNTAMYPVTAVPIVRDVVNALGTDFGYNTSPVAAMLERGIAGSKQMISGTLMTDKEISQSAIKNVTKLAGTVIGLPATGQVWKTTETVLEAIEEGEEITIREVLLGPDRK